MSVLFLNPKVHFFILFFYLKNTIFIWVNKKRNLKKKKTRKKVVHTRFWWRKNKYASETTSDVKGNN